MGKMDAKGQDGAGTHKWRSSRSEIRWSAAGSDSLRTVIDTLTANGCGIMFSRTTDGGSLVCGVYAGQERFKDYITDVGDIPAFLSFLLETYG